MKIIAIDAGASKTRVMVNDTLKPSCNKEIILNPCNYVLHGSNGIKELIETILIKFRIKSPEKYYLLAGVAGAVTTNSRIRILRIFHLYGFSKDKSIILSDTELLLNAIGNNGIILIAGTGAICVARKKLKDGNYIEAKAGGYGYRFNAEPGGYSLGLNALQICLEIEDGIFKRRSILLEEIKAHFNVQSIRGLIPLIYGSKEFQKKIAALAPLIFKCAQNNDLSSLNLLLEHTNKLSSYIKAVYSKLDFDKATVFLHGGLFKNIYSKKLFIDTLINHKNLKDLNIKFKTVGIKKSDTDPLEKFIQDFTFDKIIFHPFFGINYKDKESVNRTIDKSRESRQRKS